MLFKNTSILPLGLAVLGALNVTTAGAQDVEAIYQQNCAACHGKNLQGGSGSSLVDGKWIVGGSTEDITRVIQDGLPDRGMPPWKGGLSAEAIRGLVIYIQEQEQAYQSEQLDSKLAATSGVFSAQGETFELQTLAELDGVLWSLAFLPDGSALITAREGQLWHYRDGALTEIEGLPEVWARGQGGLLEVGVHPDYSENGWVYLSFSQSTDREDAAMTAVVRGRIKEGQWREQQTLFSTDADLHSTSRSHFGSRFVFDQGYLFFGIGDRGQKALAQDLSRPNGKMFRIHDDGRIPKDNPFVDTKKALPEIWSYGHRNPQGMAKHPQTGQLWASEHGPRGGDEINLVEPGVNYGWPVITYGMNYDGTPITSLTKKAGMAQPKLYWVPSIAVAGIDFYQGGAFSGWQNRMLVAGMASEELHLITLDGTEIVADDIILKGQGRIRDVNVGPDGHIYLLLNFRGEDKGRIVRMSPVKGSDTD